MHKNIIIIGAGAAGIGMGITQLEKAFAGGQKELD